MLPLNVWFRRFLQRRSLSLAAALRLAGISRRQAARMLGNHNDALDHVQAREEAIQRWMHDLEMTPNERLEFIYLYSIAHLPEARQALSELLERIRASEAQRIELGRLMDAVIAGMAPTPQTARPAVADDSTGPKADHCRANRHS